MTFSPALWVGFRVACASALRTQFDPDEFWQGLEPARCVLGLPCHLTWEWWTPQVRSWVHPSLLAVGLALGGRAGARGGVQGVLAGLGDAATVDLGRRLGSPSTSNSSSTAWLVAGNWFLFYCGGRTYSNAAESAFTAIALGWFWPLPEDVPRLIRGEGWGTLAWALGLAALAFACRPSAAVNWAFLGVGLLWDLHTLGSGFVVMAKVLALVSVVAGVTLALQVGLDTVMYASDRPVVTAWNFFRVNLVENVSELYGTHPWYWYVAFTFPALLGVGLPDWIALLVRAWRRPSSLSPNARRVLGLVAWGLFTASLTPHKEMRFVLPLVPPALALCSLQGRSAAHAGRWWFWAFFLVAGVLPALFLGLVHQRAPIDTARFVSDYTAAAAAAAGGAGGSPAIGGVDMLVPCHSVPLYSHMDHANPPRMRFLDCSPPLPEVVLHDRERAHFVVVDEQKGLVVDEVTQFRRDPRRFVEQRYRGGISPQARIVVITTSSKVEAVTAAFQGLSWSVKVLAEFGSEPWAVALHEAFVVMLVSAV